MNILEKITGGPVKKAFAAYNDYKNMVESVFKKALPEEFKALDEKISELRRKTSSDNGYNEEWKGALSELEQFQRLQLDPTTYKAVTGKAFDNFRTKINQALGLYPLKRAQG